MLRAAFVVVRWSFGSLGRALALLIAIGLFLWVVKGVSEPYEAPMCEQHPTYGACR